MLSLLPCRLAAIKSIRALARKLGSKEAAVRLRTTPRTLQIALSTGKVSPKLGARADTAWKRSQAASRGWDTRRENQYVADERSAIVDEKPTGIPGYGPQKLARVLQEIRKLRGDNSTQHQDVKYTIRGLESRGLPVDASLHEELARLKRLDVKLRDIEFHMAPSETIEERLYKVNNIDKEYRDIARVYNLSARAVYSLYYSPPAGPLA